MTNFSDLGVMLNDITALQSFWHIGYGIYIWEYVTTLDFELDIIRGRRSCRWSIWIYSLARSALLIAIILNLVDLNANGPKGCQALTTIQVTFAYLSIMSASLLITLRIIAVWNKNKFAVAITVITWVINIPVIIQGIARLRATWEPPVRSCVVLNVEEFKPTLIINVITDTVLLVTMVAGLFRLRTNSSRTFGVVRLLWRQGIVWLLAATVAGIPPMVFVILNLNVPFDVMFQLPSLITNTIAATRIYRSLADYPFESSNISLSAGLSKSDSKVSKRLCNNPAPVSLNRMEAAVNASYEQHPTSQATLGMDTQQGDKLNELSAASDMERGMAPRI